MELKTAINLIATGVEQASPQVWADLGAGRGLFTQALASLLPASSIVYAVDSNRAALRSIMLPKGIALHTLEKDFVKDELALEPLDGILMANSFHYVADKYTFIANIRKKLKSTGRILLVEYNTEAANTWVPYPISYTSLVKFAREAGIASVKKLAEAPSVYQGSMYSALLQL
ncbi:MAG TPA: class I SAM-dependent methyltransferase [Ohtaekwangia sp.]|uniref:class I SAM-dependent methyltransferase n=1 Tax=Ohtaekwangia sp. TaxID=2066019 RepID=UPI002F95DF67